MTELTGKFYWPSDEFSVPADDLCFHAPPSPDADFRCVRVKGHPGKHDHRIDVDIRSYSHKGPAMTEDEIAKLANGLSATVRKAMLTRDDQGDFNSASFRKMLGLGLIGHTLNFTYKGRAVREYLSKGPKP